MEWLKVIDPNILFWLQNNVVSVTWNPYMIELSKIGNGGMVWIFLSLLALIRRKYRLLGVAILLSLLISLILGEGILKPLIERARPFVAYPGVDVAIVMKQPTGYSFPSGHTFASFAAATTIFCSSRKRSVLPLVLAAAIGFSRMYLFVHYPSDVLVGALLGVFSGIVAYKISMRLALLPIGKKYFI